MLTFAHSDDSWYDSRYAANNIAVLGWECLAKGFLLKRFGSDTDIEKIKNAASSSSVCGGSTGKFAFKDARTERLVVAYVTERNLARRERLESLAAVKKADVSSVALAFILHEPYESYVLVGTTKLENFVSNMKVSSNNTRHYPAGI